MHTMHITPGAEGGARIACMARLHVLWHVANITYVARVARHGGALPSACGHRKRANLQCVVRMLRTPSYTFPVPHMSRRAMYTHACMGRMGRCGTVCHPQRIMHMLCARTTEKYGSCPACTAPPCRTPHAHTKDNMSDVHPGNLHARVHVTYHASEAAHTKRVVWRHAPNAMHVPWHYGHHASPVVQPCASVCITRMWHMHMSHARNPGTHVWTIYVCL